MFRPPREVHDLRLLQAARPERGAGVDGANLLALEALTDLLAASASLDAEDVSEGDAEPAEAEGAEASADDACFKVVLKTGTISGVLFEDSDGTAGLSAADLTFEGMSVRAYRALADDRDPIAVATTDATGVPGSSARAISMPTASGHRMNRKM